MLASIAQSLITPQAFNATLFNADFVGVIT